MNWTEIWAAHHQRAINAVEGTTADLLLEVRRTIDHLVAIAAPCDEAITALKKVTSAHKQSREEC